jgi:hypothetical protein
MVDAPVAAGLDDSEEDEDENEDEDEVGAGAGEGELRIGEIDYEEDLHEDEEEGEDEEEDEEEDEASSEASDTESEASSSSGSDASSSSAPSITAFDTGADPSLAFMAEDIPFGSEGEEVAEDKRSRPTITLPPDIYDGPETKTSGRKKGKAAVWSDPADAVLRVDLEEEKRLKKLARGKEGSTKVSGVELEKRLREQ